MPFGVMLMVTKDHNYKKVSSSELRRELTQVALDVYGADTEGLIELYADNAGLEPRGIWELLCNNYPGLRTPTYGDDSKIIEILAEIDKRSKAPKKTLLREQLVNDTAEIMEVLNRKYRFITAEDTKVVYYYNEGVFKEATTLIEKEVEAHFEDVTSTYFTNEIINHLRRRTYTNRDKFNTDKTRIPLKNGLFNLETFELEPFDENKIFTFRIPIMYDADAECPHIKAWIEEIVKPDSRDLLQEFSGYGFMPRLPLHKSLWLHGFGRNGKGAFMRLYAKAIGGENESKVPLDQMNAKFRFTLIRLLDKFVNVCSEPQSNYVFQTEIFKALTGADGIEGEIKGLQDTIKFTSFAKMFIMGNKFPNINDDTIGFWDRMEIVNFPNDYSENFIEDIEDKMITEDGGEDQAMAGFFNWCMDGLRRLTENHYKLSKSKSSEETRLEFEKVSNSIKAFITECVILKADERYTQPTLWNDYKEYCERFDLQLQQKSIFTARMGELRGVRLGKAKVNGKNQRVWFGLRFRDYEEEENDGGGEEENEKGGQSEQSGLSHIPTHGKNKNKNKIIIDKNIEMSPLSPLSTATTKPEKCVCGKQFDTIEVLWHHQANCPEFQANQDKEAKTSTPTSPLSSLIKSVVGDATEKNENGVVELALINHVAKRFQFSADEVKAGVEKMLRDGELMRPTQDFVKLVDDATDEEEDDNEKEVEEITKAVGKITEGDPDFLERYDSDTITEGCVIVQTVLEGDGIEIEDSTIATVLEEMMSQNQKINGGKTNE